MTDHRHFVEVLNDSMGPRIPAGAHALIDPDKFIEPGDRSLFEVACEFKVLQELVEDGGELVLRSADPECADIYMDADVKPIGRAMQVSIDEI